MATTPNSREWCSTVTIEGKHPKVAVRDVVVGDVITTAKNGNSSLATKRTAHAMNGAKSILKKDVPGSLHQKACNSIALAR